MTAEKKPDLVLEIKGQPVSKSNSRQLARWGNRVAFIKSPEGRKYAESAAKQLTAALTSGRIPYAPFVKEGPVRIVATLYYRSHRPDLDESIVLDALQGFAYKNDRQVREKHIFHGIDADDPRAEIQIWRIGT